MPLILKLSQLKKLNEIIFNVQADTSRRMHMDGYVGSQPLKFDRKMGHGNKCEKINEIIVHQHKSTKRLSHTHTYTPTNSHLEGRETQYVKVFFVLFETLNWIHFQKVKVLLRLIWKEFLFSVGFVFYFFLTLCIQTDVFHSSFFSCQRKKIRLNWFFTFIVALFRQRLFLTQSV